MKMKIAQEKFVYFFAEIDLDIQEVSGGKGKNLAELYRNRFSVPEGFIILPKAFIKNNLKSQAWEQIKLYLIKFYKKTKVKTLAVRSSAMYEDSVDASFSGQFETQLKVSGEEDIKAAIQNVAQSRLNERVRAYSQAIGVQNSPQIAVIVQEFIDAELSGVLFTIDPITGNRSVIVGNIVFGGGESLVSGNSDAFNFTIQKGTGRYEGFTEIKKYAKKLRKLALKIEAHFNYPQDIEFAIVKQKIYVLQSRPVTTLKGHNPQVGEWNDSLLGDFLWTNVNSSEAAPNILTPSSWSIIQTLYEEVTPLKNFLKHIPFVGNIGGRLYFNITFSYALYRLTMTEEDTLYTLQEIYGKIPNELYSGLRYSFSKLQLLSLFPSTLFLLLNYRKLKKIISQYLNETQIISTEIKLKLETVSSNEELLAIWKDQLKPVLYQTFWMMLVVINEIPQKIVPLKRKLTDLIGETDANLLISNIGKKLPSLGPLIGIYQVARGEMTEKEYHNKFGHRCPDEFELSVPKPAEISNWLQPYLNQLKNSTFDIEKAMDDKKIEFEKAWKKLEGLVKKKKLKTIKKQLREVNLAGTNREAVRSEYARIFSLIRRFYLKAGQITRLHTKIFFLTINEVLEVLSGTNNSLKYISVRKKNYQRYLKLPPYPAYIYGNFEPLDWATDPNHRIDFYNSTRSESILASKNIIKGIAGAKGQIEGVVRCLKSPEDGKLLKSGEILVTRTTNIGWTPLFPQLKAIVTDVGASLSHAAIIARELGIPAIVGCGDATSRLKTGDRIYLDGEKGIIKILDSRS